MKLYLVLALLLMVGSCQALHWQSPLVLNYEELGSGVDAWTLNSSANAHEVEHFCHMHQPQCHEELVYVLVGNRTIELKRLV